MKLLLFLGLLSFSTFVRAENVQQCTSTLQSMADLTRSYTELLNSCRELEQQGQRDSRSYEGYTRITRNTESLYSKYQSICNVACKDTYFCDGNLSGACP